MPGTTPFAQISTRRWRFITRTIEATYPNWRQVVPDARARITLELDPSKLEPIIQTIERLPCHDERYHTLGMEWKDKQLFLLGKQHPADPWTRVPVCAVKGDGPDVTVLLDRQFLIKALQFGLNTIGIIDEISPLRFCQGGRQMIVMPLRPDATQSRPASAPSAAPAQVAPPATPPRSAESPPPTPMPNTETTTPVVPQPRNPADRPPLETALARLETIKAAYRETLAELSRLSDVLKQALRDQRISQRESHTMRSTLRSLQSLRL
jgi:hypothetical protein